MFSKKVFIILSLLIILSIQEAWGWGANDWQSQYDFDGDGITDRIEYEFSGGAHCCYKISVILSSNHKEYKLPFSVDGGYVGGLDLSQPEHFFIKDFDHDRNLEMLIKIETHNDKKYPIPNRWKKKYGFKTHCILVDFKKGTLHIRDLDQSLCGQ